MNIDFNYSGDNNCKLLDDFLLVYGLISSSKFLDEIERFKNCSQNKYTYILDLKKQLLENPIKDKKKINEIFEKKMRPKALRVYNLKRSAKDKKIIFNEIRSFLKKRENEEETGAEKFLRYDDLINIAKEKQIIFWSDLLLVLVAVDSGNSIWAKNILEKMIKQSPEEISFTMEQYILDNEKERVEIEHSLISVLRFIREKINDRLLFKFFINNVYEASGPRLQEEIKKFFDMDWSLNLIRKLVKDHIYGEKFIGSIVKILVSRSSNIELKNYLDSKITEKRVAEMPFNLFWIFHDYFPTDEKIRNIIIKRIRKEFLGENPYYQYLSIKLMENELIKHKLEKNSTLFKKPYFHLKRDLYKNFLKRGIAINFSIFNLLKLGDFNTDYILWKVIR